MRRVGLSGVALFINVFVEVFARIVGDGRTLLLVSFGGPLAVLSARRIKQHFCDFVLLKRRGLST